MDSGDFGINFGHLLGGQIKSAAPPQGRQRRIITMGIVLIPLGSFAAILIVMFLELFAPKEEVKEKTSR